MQQNSDKLVICTLIIVLAVQTATIFFLIYKFNSIHHSLALNDVDISKLDAVLKIHSNNIVNVNNTVTETVTTLDCFFYQAVVSGVFTVIWLLFFRG